MLRERLLIVKLHVHRLAANNHLIGVDRKNGRRFGDGAVSDIELSAVPGADDLATVQLPAAKFGVVVRAPVFQSVKPTLEITDNDRQTVDVDGGGLIFGEIGYNPHFV